MIVLYPKETVLSVLSSTYMSLTYAITFSNKIHGDKHGYQIKCRNNRNVFVEKKLYIKLSTSEKEGIREGYSDRKIIMLADREPQKELDSWMSIGVRGKYKNKTITNKVKKHFDIDEDEYCVLHFPVPNLNKGGDAFAWTERTSSTVTK